MATAPSAMNTPRSTSAITIPTNSACCSYTLGTLKLAMMTMKRNRLSPVGRQIPIFRLKPR
jgi:hypothetical protein